MAHAASTATIPSARATRRQRLRRSSRNRAASTAVTTGFIEMTTAPNTAGAPCSRASYNAQNCTACMSTPATMTWHNVRPVGQTALAMSAQMAKMAPASAKRATNTSMGVMADTESAPIG
ncbi:Uncharacterised protein [Mycobacteroides abscessus subsp. abscessus]|nr:Uncharacterised protein [Mycobacteroides abscessus subsp. abscessus]